MNEIINSVDVIELARQYQLYDNDVLTEFICDLLDISPDRLFEILDSELDDEDEEEEVLI